MQLIRTLLAQEIYTVRQEILRPGKTLENCVFIGDDFQSTQHFGVFEDDVLTAIASVFFNPISPIEDRKSVV